MAEEELNKKQIRINRWILFIILLITATGYVFAFRESKVWMAIAASAFFGIALSIFGRDKEHPEKTAGAGFSFGCILFELWVLAFLLIK